MYSVPLIPVRVRDKERVNQIPALLLLVTKTVTWRYLRNQSMPDSIVWLTKIPNFLQSWQPVRTSNIHISVTYTAYRTKVTLAWIV